MEYLLARVLGTFEHGTGEFEAPSLGINTTEKDIKQT